METPEKENDSLDNTDYPQENNLTGIDILVVHYYMKFCGCPGLFVYFITLVFLWCPLVLFLVYFREPYKRIVIIDEDKKELIVCNRGLLSCCCNFDGITYDLKNIKKIRLYATWRPDPKVGFKKLYYMNCEIISLNDESGKLFENIDYDEKKHAEFVTFFKKHLKTEVEPLETATRAKDLNLLANYADDSNLNYNIMKSDDFNNPMVNNNDLNMGNEMGFHNPTTDMGGMSMFP